MKGTKRTLEQRHMRLLHLDLEITADSIDSDKSFELHLRLQSM